MRNNRKLVAGLNLFMNEAFIIPIAHAGVITDAPTLARVGWNMLQYLLGIVGLIAIIGFVVSGALYFFSAGNERMLDRAKKSFWASVIGVVISLSALIIIRVVQNWLL